MKPFVYNSFWWKTPFNRWWMRFARPFEYYNTSGCFDDSHDGDCVCQQTIARVEDRIKARGYVLVGHVAYRGKLWWNGHTFIQQIHIYGR